MRKAAVLMLVLGTACLALAGSEQWIGAGAAHHYAIPNPVPGVFPAGPDVFRPALDTFKYDDNMAVNAWAWNGTDQGWGVKFISPSDNITVAGVLFYRYGGWPTPGGDRGLFAMYADDGPNGSPLTELWRSDTVTGLVEDVWNFVAVDEPVIGSNYYLFYIQVDTYPVCPGMPLDGFNNAPSHRMWKYSVGSFSESSDDGEWMIRSVVDWTPQEHNAAPLWFASNMPKDTVPDINLYVRALVRNHGTADLPLGTPVRLHISGPGSYTYDDTMLTTANLVRGQTQQMNFSPAWRIPVAAGDYLIQVWTEAADEDWTWDDTIAYDLSVAEWIEYGDYTAGNWITWGGPLRATMFDPADFGLAYPVGLSRVRAQFYLLDPPNNWNDSSFQFKIFGDDGVNLLWEGDTLEAPAGTPGLVIADDLDSMMIFESGTFYVAIDPVSSRGYPSNFADAEPDGHSFQGSPGSWTPWNLGEYFISAACVGGVGLEEEQPRVRRPMLAVANYPNPVTDAVTIRWELPARQRASVDVFDATGRLVRNLYDAADGVSGSAVLDTRYLAAGIYLVRLETQAGTATRKLVLGR